MYLITVPSFNIFSLTFYNKFVEIYKLFPCKTAYYVKRQKNFQNFFFIIFFSGLDMELEPEPEPQLFKIGNRNHNFSKVGTATGTGTITFQKSEPEPEPLKIVTVPQRWFVNSVLNNFSFIVGEFALRLRAENASKNCADAADIQGFLLQSSRYLQHKVRNRAYSTFLFI
jgi:hypothetical protein